MQARSQPGLSRRRLFDVAGGMQHATGPHHLHSPEKPSRGRYKLILSAKSPVSSSSLRFEAPLGATQTETFTMRVFNSSVQAAEFDCRLVGAQGSHFRVPAKVKALGESHEATAGAGGRRC